MNEIVFAITLTCAFLQVHSESLNVPVSNEKCLHDILKKRFTVLVGHRFF